MKPKKKMRHPKKLHITVINLVYIYLSLPLSICYLFVPEIKKNRCRKYKNGELRCKFNNRFYRVKST